MIANSLDVNMPWILNARHLLCLLWQKHFDQRKLFPVNIVRSKVSMTPGHQISLALPLSARCLVRYSLTTILEQVVVDKRPAAAPSLMGGMILMEWIFYQRITSQTIASHFFIKFVDDWPPNSMEHIGCLPTRSPLWQKRSPPLLPWDSAPPLSHQSTLISMIANTVTRNNNRGFFFYQNKF